MIRRRDWLASAASIAATAPAEGAESPGKLRVVVVGGHPGDPEYGCGGTIARLSRLGHEVALLYLNEGVPAGRPADGVRVAEARAACAILGARAIFAGQVDGDSVVDRAHADAFRAILEAERPDIVFTHWPIDNHADHRAASNLAFGAWVALGRRFALYYYEVSDGEDTLQFSPTEYVDIGGFEATKRRACFAHESQSPEKYHALQEQISRFRGLEIGSGQAEGFVRLSRGPEIRLPIAR